MLLEDGSEIRVIDVRTDGGEIFAAPKLKPGNGAAWTAPLFIDDGSILVSESCCEPNPDRYRLMAVDPATSKAEMVADVGDPARTLDVHPTAAGLLLSIEGAGGPELWSLVDGSLVFVARNVTDAVWIPAHGIPAS